MIMILAILSVAKRRWSSRINESKLYSEWLACKQIVTRLTSRQIQVKIKIDFLIYLPWEKSALLRS
jgi:hypothetical protein